MFSFCPVPIDLLRKNSFILKENEVKRGRSPELISEALAIDMEWRQSNTILLILSHIYEKLGQKCY